MPATKSLRRPRLNSPPDIPVSPPLGDGAGLVGAVPAQVEGAQARPPKPRRQAPERTCLVSRVVRAPEAMIRFVRAPDGTVVADPAERLPGRGAWVSADRGMLIEARQRNVFARGFKTADLSFDADAEPWVDAIAAQLADRALAHLGLARRAGHLIVGTDNVLAALRRNGQGAAAIVARDAQTDAAGKIAGVAKRGGAVLVRVFSEATLSRALGLDHLRYAVLPARFGSPAFIAQAARYAGVAGVEAPGMPDEPADKQGADNAPEQEAKS